MTRNASLVFRGWLDLSQTEKNELVTEINNYIRSNPSQKSQIQSRALTETKLAFDTGPTSSSSCPCCGRG